MFFSLISLQTKTLDFGLSQWGWEQPWEFTEIREEKKQYLPLSIWWPTDKPRSTAETATRVTCRKKDPITASTQEWCSHVPPPPCSQLTPRGATQASPSGSQVAQPLLGAVLLVCSLRGLVGVYMSMMKTCFRLQCSSTTSQQSVPSFLSWNTPDCTKAWTGIHTSRSSTFISGVTVIQRIPYSGMLCSNLTEWGRNFPDGSVAKTLSSQCRVFRFHPWSGN